MTPPLKKPWAARRPVEAQVYAVAADLDTGLPREIVVDGIQLLREPDRLVQLRLTVTEAQALAWGLVRLFGGEWPDVVT